MRRLGKQPGFPGRTVRLWWLVGIVILGPGAGCLVASDPPPGIVFLYADDAGYADFGFQPAVRDDMRHLTPHIDSLARDGARFSSAYMSASVCSPSRAGLMTGRYQQRFGHDNNIPPGYMRGGLPLSETFVARRLHDLGYATGLVGKWHLGYPEEYHPNERGFGFFYGCLQGSRSYFPIDQPSPHRVFLENREPTPEGGYTTDRIGEAACRFVREHADQPFFLFVSFTAPHGPMQAKPEDLELLSGIKPTRRHKYAGLVKALDDNCGKILECLEETGVADHTLVIFTNDNGGQTQTGADNFPLQGRKGTLWEGGIRVPMAARWPGVITPGSVIDDPVISLDWLPTFVEASGNPVAGQWQLDGVSLLDRLQGTVDRLPERTLFWRRHGQSVAARRGDWKMIDLREGTDSVPRLYHLGEDIGETEDRSDEHPEILQQLQDQTRAWESELGRPRWGMGAGNRGKSEAGR